MPMWRASFLKLCHPNTLMNTRGVLMFSRLRIPSANIYYIFTNQVLVAHLQRNGPRTHYSLKGISSTQDHTRAIKDALVFRD